MNIRKKHIWAPENPEGLEGCYKGMLKQPEYTVDHPGVKELLGNTAVFRRLCLTDFPGCCGVKILYNFEEVYRPFSFAGRDLRNFISKNEKFYESFCIHKIHQRLESNNEKHAIADDDDYLLKWTGGKYVLVTLNKNEMEEGIDKLLEEYFGFVRLENNFVNIGESPRIGIWGLCFSEFEV